MEGRPSQEGKSFVKGGIVQLRAELMSPELIDTLIDKIDIAMPLQIFYIQGDTVYVGPTETSLTDVMAWEPGKEISEGPVLPINKKFLEVSSSLRT